jgi:hypothetical protein
MQVNRRDITPMVKVTITTFFSVHQLKVFSKIMIEGQEVMERIRLIFVEGQTTKEVFPP